MQVGSLKKRLMKASRKLHRSMDNTAHATAIAGYVERVEKSIDDALKGVEIVPEVKEVKKKAPKKDK